MTPAGKARKKFKVPALRCTAIDNHWLPGARPVLARLLWAVAMHDFHPISGLPQMFAHLFGNHDGTVLAASAAEGDGQVALPFMNVVRQQVHQKIGDARDELLSLRETSECIWRRADGAPSAARNSGTKCGLGRKRTSKTRSASSGTPWRNPKLTQDTRMFFSDDCCRKRSVM